MDRQLGLPIVRRRLVYRGEWPESIVKMRPAILVNDSEAFVACALAGLGMVQALDAGVAALIAAGRLVEVLPGMETVPRPVSIMYPNRQHLALQVRVFIDWATEIFKLR